MSSFLRWKIFLKNSARLVVRAVVGGGAKEGHRVDVVKDAVRKVPEEKCVLLDDCRLKQHVGKAQQQVVVRREVDVFDAEVEWWSEAKNLRCAAAERARRSLADGPRRESAAAWIL